MSCCEETRGLSCFNMNPLLDLVVATSYVRSSLTWIHKHNIYNLPPKNKDENSFSFGENNLFDFGFHAHLFLTPEM